jgi:cytochrome c oxidase cbb3-type subunit 3
MKSFCCVLLLLCPLAAQTTSGPNLEEGKAVFRSNCAFCHGLTGGGGRGPALNTGQFVHGSTDEDIRRVIRNGVPGAQMPAFRMDKDELDGLVRFVRALSSSGGSRQPIPGDAAKGREVYARSGCAGCHRIGSEGSVYGPELTRVGAARSAEYIRESLVNPTADIPDDYEGVTVVTRDGQRITGVRANEDTFTVQLREPSQKFRMFSKNEVREVIHEKNSLMPAYASLASADLQNLLAYLNTLRGEVKTGADVKKVEGIR